MSLYNSSNDDGIDFDSAAKIRPGSGGGIKGSLLLYLPLVFSACSLIICGAILSELKSLRATTNDVKVELQTQILHNLNDLKSELQTQVEESLASQIASAEAHLSNTTQDGLRTISTELQSFALSGNFSNTIGSSMQSQMKSLLQSEDGLQKVITTSLQSFAASENFTAALDSVMQNQNFFRSFGKQINEILKDNEIRLELGPLFEFILKTFMSNLNPFDWHELFKTGAEALDGLAKVDLNVESCIRVCTKGTACKDQNAVNFNPASQARPCENNRCCRYQASLRKSRCQTMDGASIDNHLMEDKCCALTPQYYTFPIPQAGSCGSYRCMDINATWLSNKLAQRWSNGHHPKIISNPSSIWASEYHLLPITNAGTTWGWDDDRVMADSNCWRNNPDDCVNNLHEYGTDDHDHICQAQFYELWETCDPGGLISSTKDQDGDKTGPFDDEAECVILASETLSNSIDACLDGPLKEYIDDLGEKSLPKGDTRDSFAGGNWAYPEYSFVLWMNDWVKPYVNGSKPLPVNEVISILNYTKSMVPVVVHFVNYINYEKMEGNTTDGCFGTDDLDTNADEGRMTDYSDLIVSEIVNNNINVFINLLDRIQAAFVSRSSGHRRG